MIIDSDIFTRLADLPTAVRSYVMKSGDEYTIFLNSRLSHERQLLAYKHELDHIRRGDYDKTCSAGLIELFAHRE